MCASISTQFDRNLPTFSIIKIWNGWECWLLSLIIRLIRIELHYINQSVIVFMLALFCVASKQRDCVWNILSWLCHQRKDHFFNKMTYHFVTFQHASEAPSVSSRGDLWAVVLVCLTLLVETKVTELLDRDHLHPPAMWPFRTGVNTLDCRFHRMTRWRIQRSIRQTRPCFFCRSTICKAASSHPNNTLCLDCTSGEGRWLPVLLPT